MRLIWQICSLMCWKYSRIGVLWYNAVQDFLRAASEKAISQLTPLQTVRHDVLSSLYSCLGLGGPESILNSLAQESTTMNFVGLFSQVMMQRIRPNMTVIELEQGKEYFTPNGSGREAFSLFLFTGFCHVPVSHSSMYFACVNICIGFAKQVIAWRGHSQFWLIDVRNVSLNYWGERRM